MPLYTILVEDNFGIGQQRQATTALDTVFRYLDYKEMNAVKEIFSSATLKLCLFYALATVDKRLAEAKLRRNVREEIYQKLQETVYASSEEIITDVEEYLCRFGKPFIYREYCHG
ncbi:hypothetical protein OUZ56_012620 [Daphnia magna]|uniref:Uncharacterized protein n=1 Tax=Daphnia magna TaxID=35525 RepID=A0ABQ9Z3J8_9CRUS|nr:hypothetical protein OUZ56_012620 [Daphnia magna]